MKRLIMFIGTFVCIAGLCMYILNRDSDYDFLRQFDMVSQLEFSNPLDSFKMVSDSFSNLGNSSNFWEGIFDTISSIGTLLYAPINCIYEIIKNIVLFLQAILIMLGFKF